MHHASLNVCLLCTYWWGGVVRGMAFHNGLPMKLVKVTPLMHKFMRSIRSTPPSRVLQERSFARLAAEMKIRRMILRRLR